MRAFEEVFVSLTHGGEALSLAAARAVLDAIADGLVLAGIEQRGLRLRDGIAGLIEEHGIGDRVTVGGEPQRAVVDFRGAEALVDRSWVQQCLVERSILFNGSMFVCARHRDEDIDQTLEAFDAAFGALAQHDDVRHLLAGEPVEPVFRE
jgi:glutamate-1-semialdehyde 2,1-aminomutase/spore coat polysaccharide biosynthesis protein SpsF